MESIYFRTGQNFGKDVMKTGITRCVNGLEE